MQCVFFINDISRHIKPTYIGLFCIYICKIEVEINEIRNFYKIGAEFENTPPSIIGNFFALTMIT